MIYILTKRNNGEEVRLQAGDELEIHLEGNLTTGYTWEVVQNNPLVLKHTAGPLYHAEKVLLGTPGRMIFKFEAVAPGDSELGLAYRRSWEENQPPLETFRTSVKVEPVDTQPV